MGYQIPRATADQIFIRLQEHYDIYAPKLFVGGGCFSDTDVVRYDKVTSLAEIVFDRRSDYSFKESLLPVNETLFYFTEDTSSVPAAPKKELLIFLRSCDIHALKRLDAIYLKNGSEDFYYKRLREKAAFVLMGCPETCDTGFCVSMGSNRTDDYDLYLKCDGDTVLVDCPSETLAAWFTPGTCSTETAAEGSSQTPVSKDSCQESDSAGNIDATIRKCTVTPDFVTENHEKVTLPKNLSTDSFSNPLWQEYGSRCIGCGRCNFVCPTCTCFTMQDILYRDNENVGERRRVWASCQVDGYTDIAGGNSFRKTQGERMRFKVMHKIYDFEKRFGFPMCVGCGRCDAVCPEYISYANLVNKLAKEEA